METERHIYTSVCDSCRTAKDVTLAKPARDQFEATPEEWETVFVQYKTLQRPDFTSNDDKRLWLKLCGRCKPKTETPRDVVKEDDRRWFVKLFQARKFGDTRPKAQSGRICSDDRG